ncbi:MAG TPA: fibronectin type III domain-containing protein [Nitrospiria bacterium]|nr:fibronectin type III domain-containing protein [Nitrospiria bacterium]
MKNSYKLTSPVLLVLSLSAFSPAWGSEWTMEFRVSVPDSGADGGVSTQRLEAGSHPSASDAFDNEWDVVALPAGPVQALITHDGEAGYPLHLQSLWRDIRSDGVPQSWRLRIESFQSAEPISLSWSLPPLLPADVCYRQEMVLRDESTGEPLDLFGTPSVLLPSTGSLSVPEIRLFRLEVNNQPINSPSAPTGLRSQEKKRKVFLDWADNPEPDIAGYHVWKSLERGAGFGRITGRPLSESRFTDRDIQSGTVYHYAVTAVSVNGCESVLSVKTSPGPGGIRGR